MAMPLLMPKAANKAGSRTYAHCSSLRVPNMLLRLIYATMAIMTQDWSHTPIQAWVRAYGQMRQGYQHAINMLYSIQYHHHMAGSTSETP